MSESLHPSDARLASYAAGTLSDGMTLLVASHLALCPRCRDRAARLTTIGGAYLAADPAPEGVSPPPFDAVLARLDETPPGRDAEPADPVLPDPLRRATGRGSDQIRWRPILPGIADFALLRCAGEDVRLIKARPGARIPAHTHLGEEGTLVLKGQLRDGAHTLGRGDVAICGSEHDHRPQAVGQETCICLVVIAGRLRFTGPIGRALNILAR